MSKYWSKLVAQWQDATNFVLGIWLVGAPWVLAYNAEQTAAWNSYIVGVVVAVSAAAALSTFHKWEEWVNAAFGLWLVVSPWVLGFSSATGAMWNHIVVGLLVGCLALWSALTIHKTGNFAPGTR